MNFIIKHSLLIATAIMVLNPVTIAAAIMASYYFTGQDIGFIISVSLGVIVNWIVAFILASFQLFQK